MIQVLGIVLMLGLSAPGADADELCSAIGKTSQIALQPRDRIYFEKNCMCAAGDCAQRGGRKAKKLLAEEKARAGERAKLFRESKASVLAAARKFSDCTSSPTTVSCVDEASMFTEECLRHEAAFPGESPQCTIGDWEPLLGQQPSPPSKSP